MRLPALRAAVILAVILTGETWCERATAQLDAASTSVSSASKGTPKMGGPDKPIPRSLQAGPISNLSALIGGSDSCTTPDAITGLGPFPFDNTAATTGVEGQNESLCLSSSTTGIGLDVWFDWTAPIAGVATLASCGLATNDSKVAVYSGTGCPTNGSAIACNDDACNSLQSSVQFHCNSGAHFLIQWGSYPGAPGATGQFAITIATPPANDDCSTPTAIVGQGPFNFDDTAASTGAQGQSSSICSAYGLTGIANDVWYTWTAASNGFQTLSLCNGASNDSKIAVYDTTGGAACPATAAIACNDDFCGLTSQLCFNAIAGHVYTLQIGLFPGGTATGQAGTFTVRPNAPPMSNDDCGAATSITGLGPFSYDTTSATTGCQGQTNSACSFYLTPGIMDDIWFTWTAPVTSRMQLSLCGLSNGRDTKLAVYRGAGCPIAAPIACDDDGCGFVGGESVTCFDAVAGQAYTLQIGNFPLGQPGPGQFQFTTIASPTSCQYDNGTSENALALSAGGTILWMHREGGVGLVTTVTSISTAYGSALLPGSAPPNGTPAVVALWKDPNDDGDPTDAQLLVQVPTTVQNGDTDILNIVALPTPMNVPGVFFIGAATSGAPPPTSFPAPMDQNSCPASSLGRAWFAGSSSNNLDLANLAANDVPPLEMDSQGTPAVFLLRASCSPAAGVAYCFGDGTGSACPCGNNGAAGHGCANSVDASGALLLAQGTPSVTHDSLVLLGTHMPAASSCLYFQGTQPTSALFGDGLRCAGGSVIRLGVKIDVAGSSAYGHGVGSDIDISVRGAIPPAGGMRDYQVWYRNTAAFCTPSGFNLSNGMQILWVP